MVAGIVFDHSSFKHMSCSIEASWGKMGMTEVRIDGQEDLKKAKSSAKTRSNHDGSQKVMEKISQVGKR